VLTFFATCKPFRGATAVAQRNAIRSWLALGRGCEVILLGDDEGTAQAARDLGATHIGGVRRNEHGTPLLDSLFEQAKAVARHDLVCYINADIVLMSDFLDAVARLESEPLLMISRRWNVTIHGPWDFDDPAWEQKLREHTLAHGVQIDTNGGGDFFVFRRHQWSQIPPFALGRTAFDNWLIYAAIARGFPVIDASPSVLAVHQNHDYGHADGNWTGAWFGEEAARNRVLAGGAVPGGDSPNYDFLDVTHFMTPTGLAPAMSPPHMARRLERRQAERHDRQLFLAHVLHELERHDEAWAAIEESGRVATTPEQARRTIRAMLRALLATGRADEADALIHRLIVADPSPMFAYRIASICQELGAFGPAGALFRAIDSHDGNSALRLKPGARYHLAQIAAETGDADTARRSAQACLDACPDHGEARRLLESLDERAGEIGDVLTETIKNVQKSSLEVPAAFLRPVDAAD